MSDHKTPRYILRDIVEPAVNEALHDISSFPKFCLGWRSLLPESVENRIGNIVQSTQIAQEQKTNYRKRLVTFMSFWTDKTLDVTSNGCIAGISTKIFFELDFGDFVSKDIDTAYEQMRSEKEDLTRKGSWSDNIDPRFERQQKAFETILSELQEV